MIFFPWQQHASPELIEKESESDEAIRDLDDRFKEEKLFRIPDEVEEKLLKKIKSIRRSCGQVCDTTIRGKPGKVKIWQRFCTANLLCKAYSRIP